MGELIQMAPGELRTPLEQALIGQLEAQQTAMLNLAMLLRETNERMQALETEVRHLVKVTPAQAAELNAAIRAQAKEVCRIHRAAGGEKRAAAAIRKALKAICGSGTVRDILRCDYQVALRTVQLWDDYKQMEAIRNRR